MRSLSDRSRGAEEPSPADRRDRAIVGWAGGSSVGSSDKRAGRKRAAGEPRIPRADFGPKASSPIRAAPTGRNRQDGENVKNMLLLAADLTYGSLSPQSTAGSAGLASSSGPAPASSSGPAPASSSGPAPASSSGPAPASSSGPAPASSSGPDRLWRDSTSGGNRSILSSIDDRQCWPRPEFGV